MNWIFSVLEQIAKASLDPSKIMRVPIKHICSICTILLLGNIINAQVLHSFMVYEREYHLIMDAVVTVNGVSASYRNGAGYQYPDDLKPPYKVVIEHEGFLPTIIENRSKMEGEYFLIRPGEDYFYFGNVPRPCLHTPGWLLIAAKEYDGQGARLDKEAVRAKMHELIAQYGFEIVREQEIWGMDNDFPTRGNIFLIKPSIEGINQDSMVGMRRFLGNSNLEFVGPAILSSESGNAISVFPTVVAHFSNSNDWASAKEQMKNHKSLEIKFENRDNYITAKLNLGAFDIPIYNRMVEILLSLEGASDMSMEFYWFDS